MSIHHIIATIRQQTGRRYPDLEKALDGMDPAALRDVHRLLQDLEQEASRKARQAAREPWKRGF